MRINHSYSPAKKNCPLTFLGNLAKNTNTQNDDIFEACWYISRRKDDFVSLSVKFLGCFVEFLVLILIDLTLINACSALFGKILTIPRGTVVCSSLVPWIHMKVFSQNHEISKMRVVRSEGTRSNVQSQQWMFLREIVLMIVDYFMSTSCRCSLICWRGGSVKTSAPHTPTKLFKTLRPCKERYKGPPKKEGG